MANQASRDAWTRAADDDLTRGPEGYAVAIAAQMAAHLVVVKHDSHVGIGDPDVGARDRPADRWSSLRAVDSRDSLIEAFGKLPRLERISLLLDDPDGRIV